jgi:hypothetical protein
MHADPIHDTCQNAATVERNGKPYCNRHDPEAKEARAKAREAARALPDAIEAVGMVEHWAGIASRRLKALGHPHEGAAGLCADMLAEAKRVKALVREAARP